MVSSDEEPEASNESQAVQEVKQANAEWARALRQRDEAALDRILADDFVLAYPFEGDDKGQFIDDVLSGEVKVDSLESHGTTIRVSGGTGVVFGSETANWHYRGRDLSGNYRFLRIYTWKDGRWQIVALHLCSPGHH